MLIALYDDLVHSHNHVQTKWKCGSHFLSTLLPTLCEWCVQDSACQSHRCPTQITNTRVTSKFTRYKEWSERQRKKIKILLRIN